jgi:hypothetical protein
VIAVVRVPMIAMVIVRNRMAVLAQVNGARLMRQP